MRLVIKAIYFLPTDQTIIFNMDCSVSGFRWHGNFTGTTFFQQHPRSLHVQTYHSFHSSDFILGSLSNSKLAYLCGYTSPAYLGSLGLPSLLLARPAFQLDSVKDVVHIEAPRSTFTEYPGIYMPQKTTLTALSIYALASRSAKTYYPSIQKSCAECMHLEQNVPLSSGDYYQILGPTIRRASGRT